MRLQIAIAANGDLHIWTGDHMPPAANLVDVELVHGDGMWIIPADRAAPLRELLGTGEVAAQVGVRDTSKIANILAIAENLVREIRAEVDGDDDDDLPKPPGL